MKLAEIHLSVYPLFVHGMLEGEDGLVILEQMLRGVWRNSEALTDVALKIRDFLKEHRDLFSENNPFIKLELRIKEDQDLGC